jgi:hypothetical protein
MAQLSMNKFMVIGMIGVIILAMAMVAFFAPLSSIQTNNTTDYQISLDGEKFEPSLQLKPGEYKIYLKTPFYTEQQIINLGFFDKKIISVTEHESEGGINQITQKMMVRSGFPGTTVGECFKFGSYHFVCETSQLSSVRAAEMIYIGGYWKMNLDPASAQSEEAKNEMIKINSSGSQR